MLSQFLKISNLNLHRCGQKDQKLNCKINCKGNLGTWIFWQELSNLLSQRIKIRSKDVSERIFKDAKPSMPPIHVPHVRVRRKAKAKAEQVLNSTTCLPEPAAAIKHKKVLWKWAGKPFNCWEIRHALSHLCLEKKTCWVALKHGILPSLLRAYPNCPQARTRRPQIKGKYCFSSQLCCTLVSSHLKIMGLVSAERESVLREGESVKISTIRGCSGVFSLF